VERWWRQPGWWTLIFMVLVMAAGQGSGFFATIWHLGEDVAQLKSQVQKLSEASELGDTRNSARLEAHVVQDARETMTLERRVSENEKTNAVLLEQVRSNGEWLKRIDRKVSR
jgi:stress response protein SCP2